MKTRTAGLKRTQEKQTAGQEIIASLSEAVRWMNGEKVSIRITTLHVKQANVRCHLKEQERRETCSLPPVF